MPPSHRPGDIFIEMMRKLCYHMLEVSPGVGTSQKEEC